MSVANRELLRGILEINSDLVESSSNSSYLISWSSWVQAYQYPTISQTYQLFEHNRVEFEYLRILYESSAYKKKNNSFEFESNLNI